MISNKIRRLDRKRIKFLEFVDYGFINDPVTAHSSYQLDSACLFCLLFFLYIFGDKAGAEPSRALAMGVGFSARAQNRNL